MQVVRWALMRRFLSVCLSVCLTGGKDPSDSSICLSMLVICGNLRVGSMSTSSCIFIPFCENRRTVFSQ